jgi:hypothetical protein
VIEDGVSGLLVPAGDSEAMASRILEALECEEGLHDLGFQGRQRVLECFSFPAQVEAYLDLLDRLVTATPSGDVTAEAHPGADPCHDVVHPEPLCDR